MFIKAIQGYELEKAQSNTSEDFFNSSEVTLVDNGKEKTFYLLYVRYFDEICNEFVPFENDPLFTIDEKPIYFKDVIGLLALLHKPDYQNRKRVYINEKKELQEICQGVQAEELQEIVAQIFKSGYELKDLVNR